jgi:cytochrome c biogenesis protein CcmG/thiol:disulfide interchange protein DsbE|tara:strand:+ start:3807 stop:4325 length:519 start_codon:yes stop_codon:yes gene_type:complete
MKNKIFLIISISILIFIFIIFYNGLHKINIYSPKVELNKKIPTYSSKLINSEKLVNYSEIFNYDSFILLNIWSSWCVPCRDEHRLLMNLKRQTKIRLIGLNYKDNVNSAQKFLDELGNPFEIILIDPKGIQAVEWGAFGVPETFLIINNKIVKKYVGPLDENLIEEIKLMVK